MSSAQSPPMESLRVPFLHQPLAVRRRNQQRPRRKHLIRIHPENSQISTVSCWIGILFSATSSPIPAPSAISQSAPKSRPPRDPASQPHRARSQSPPHGRQSNPPKIRRPMDKSRRKSRQKLIPSCLCQIRHRAKRNPLRHDKIQIRCHTRRIKQPRTRCPACRRHGKHRIQNPVRHLRMPADHRSSIPHTRTVNRPHQLL